MDRFGTINAFVDFAPVSLTRNEVAVWLVLWRDEKNGTVRTTLAEAEATGKPPKRSSWSKAALTLDGLQAAMRHSKIDLTMNVDTDPNPLQIGRASCRERV